MEKNRSFHVFLIIIAIFTATPCTMGLQKKDMDHTNDSVLESRNICHKVFFNDSIDKGGYVKDSMDEYGNRTRLFGNDSIYTYYENGSIKNILYLTENYYIDRKLFNDDGSLDYIEYNPFYAKDSLLSEYYYPGMNKLHSSYWLKDSIIITEDNPLRTHEYFTRYYENGKIKEYGHFGYPSGQGGGPIGIITYLDTLGNIDMTKNHVFPVQSLADIFNTNLYTYIIETKFHKNGMIEWEKKYSNNGYYEIDDDQVKSLGTWKYYNEEGELVKTEEYGENGELVKTKIYGLNN